MCGVRPAYGYDLCLKKHQASHTGRSPSRMPHVGRSSPSSCASPPGSTCTLRRSHEPAWTGAGPSVTAPSHGALASAPHVEALKLRQWVGTSARAPLLQHRGVHMCTLGRSPRSAPPPEELVPAGTPDQPHQPGALRCSQCSTVFVRNFSLTLHGGSTGERSLTRVAGVEKTSSGTNLTQHQNRMRL